MRWGNSASSTKPGLFSSNKKWKSFRVKEKGWNITSRSSSYCFLQTDVIQTGGKWSQAFRKLWSMASRPPGLSKIQFSTPLCSTDKTRFQIKGFSLHKNWNLTQKNVCIRSGLPQILKSNNYISGRYININLNWVSIKKKITFAGAWRFVNSLELFTFLHKY